MFQKVKINGHSFFVKKNASILEACAYIGLAIPRFCYHKDLSIAGNCRMCLIEIKASNKLVAACAFPISNEMEIYTNTPKVIKARQNIIQFLLLNHPLDCPICDQGGECDLQDQAKIYGNAFSVNYFKRRTVEDKKIHLLIKPVMNRCIHCTRCVRFGKEIAGKNFLGTLTRGNSTEIGLYNEESVFFQKTKKKLNKEISSLHTYRNFNNLNIPSNKLLDAILVTEICPVGALLPNPDSISHRPWEVVQMTPILDLTDGLGSNLYADVKNNVLSVVTGAGNFHINGMYCSDKARLSINRIIYENRLTSYQYFNSVGIETKKSFECLLQPIKTTKSKVNLFFYVNSQMDSLFLNFLKTKENTNKIYSIKTYEKKHKYSNLYLSNLYNKIATINSNTISTYVIIGCNLQVEALLLSKRLRSKSLTNKIYIINSSQGISFDKQNEEKYYSSNIYLHISIKNILKIIEGRNKFSKYISVKYNPLFFFGESFFKYIQDTNVLLNHILKYIPTARFLKINLNCNDEAISFFNITNVKPLDIKKNFKTEYFSFFFNCEYNNSLFKILKYDNIFFTKNRYLGKIMFNTKISNMPPKYLKNTLLSPMPTFYENLDTMIFINSEGRAQKNKKLYNTCTVSMTSLLISFISQNFNTNKTIDSNIDSTQISFLKNMCTNVLLFDRLQPKFSKLQYFKKNIFVKYTEFKSQPLKLKSEIFNN